MKTKLFWLGLASVLMCPTPGWGQDASPWKAFTSPEGKFRAEMPGEPLKLTQKTRSPVGELTATMFMVAPAHQKHGYLISYMDLPKETFQLEVDDDELLEVGRDGMVAKLPGAKLVSDKKITLGTHPGREMHIGADKPNLSARVRCYLVRPRLYVIAVLGPDDFLNTNDATRFLESFQLAEADNGPKAKPPKAGAPPAWKTFAYKPGAYSVALPADPLVLTPKSIPTPDGELKVHTVALDDGKTGITYSITHVDLPGPGVPPGTEDLALELAQEDMVKASKGKLLGHKSIQTAGYPGRDLRIEMFEGKTLARVRLVLVNNRLYQLMLLEPMKTADDKNAEQFFNSFQLKGPTISI